MKNKLFKENIYNIIIYIIIIIIITYIIYKKINRIEKYTNSTSRVIIRNMISDNISTQTTFLYPIIKNIYSNSDIIFTDNIDIKADLIIKSLVLNKEFNNEKCIIFDENPLYSETQHYKKFHEDQCICYIGTSMTKMNEFKKYKPNTKFFYLPYFLNRNIINGTNMDLVVPFKPTLREITNTNRSKLLAYVATNRRKHRTEFFLKIRDRDATAEALGNDCKTVDYTLESGWNNLKDVYSKYKFVMAFENSNEDGYITEKIMNVYISGAIPIYWGTSKVKEIFNPESFIYAPDYKNYDECINTILEISNDPSRLLAMQTADPINKNIYPNYFKYYDIKSPEWVLEISNYIKNKI
jgi:hypothetical protein